MRIWEDFRPVGTNPWPINPNPTQSTLATGPVSVRGRSGGWGRASLLALHGFRGAGEDFALFTARTRHAVLAPDLPGHGGTATDDPRDYALAASRLWPLLAEAPVVLEVGKHHFEKRGKFPSTNT